MASGKHSASQKKKRGNALIGVLVVVLVVVACYFVGTKVIGGGTTGEVHKGQEITVVIPEGTTANRVGEILCENHVIASSNEFKQAVTSRNVSDQIKAGTYRFVGGESVDNIIDTMISGHTGYTLTIPEGYTAKQIAKAAAASCEVNEDEFYKLTLKASNYVSEYPFLEGVYNDSLEGFLFPDTYTVEYGATSDAIIRQMLDNFATRIASVDMSYASSKNLNIYDVVTLASMVEKESREDADKKSISSVFYNRLHEGMTLGSDVTTYYAVGKDLTEDLTKEDLASDSPYNTRNPKNHGLPAGPICSPGLVSLEAAAHPDETDYLYFFYSEKKDKTLFYKDHASFEAAWKKLGQ